MTEEKIAIREFANKPELSGNYLMMKGGGWGSDIGLEIMRGVT